MSNEGAITANPAFDGAGQSAGIEVWRIENFEPVRQDPANTGSFYNKDAYIILNTKNVPGSNHYSYDAHFWLGKYASQDVSGAAAILTVELDTFVLGQSSIQHREVQGHESKLFLSYFKNGGIRYLEGGVGSSFREVDPNAFEKRLFQVKGRKNVRVEQVECKFGSLNQGDTFVLDDGRNIYVWVGPTSEKKERLGGVETARRIRDEERGGNAHIHIIEDDWDSNEEFFAALGSRDKTIKAGDPASDDDDMVRKLDQAILLYKVTEGHGDKWEHGTVEDVTELPLQQSALDSEHCFILDSGYSGIFVWTGKKVSNDFKRKVWTAVNLFIERKGYPHWVSVSRVTDGGESAFFKQYFESWDDGKTTRVPSSAPAGNKVAAQDYSGADGLDMANIHGAAPKAEEWMPDDGSGKKLVWRLENKELVPVAERAYGVFFGGDSYVIQYDYEEKNKEKHIIYFWQGLKSPTESQGAAAGHAVRLADTFGGNAIQIRVVMFKEPVHFMKIFGGKLVCFSEGRVKGYRGVRDHENYDPKEVYMFQVRGTSADATRAVQVNARAASLNSNDLFIVASHEKTFVWIGKHSGEQEIEMAKHMGEKIGEEISPVILEEGRESPGFWNALGGREPYYEGQRVEVGKLVVPVRLFQCSMTSGRFAVEEIVDFHQEDLDEGDVMLLDTHDEIFLWLGNGCSEFEKKESAKTAYNYLTSSPDGRTPDNTLIIVVHQGFEPPQFTGCFLAWDPNKWAEGKTFHELMNEVGKENAGISLLEDEVTKYTSFYPLEELQRQVPPTGVDVTRKEMYLSDEDFVAVFGMSKDEFMKFPEWKRTNMRREHQLF